MHGDLGTINLLRCTVQG